MTQDRPLLGIALMFGFCVVAPLGDSTAKILGATVPLMILLVARFAVQAIALYPVIWATGTSARMPKGTLGFAWIRAMLHIIGIGAMFTALQFLPLADAVAIAFVMPFLMLLLGHTFLGEDVGPRRIIACCVGFIGTLLVIQPAFDAVGWPALLPLVVAVVFSLYMLVTRKIAKQVDPVPLQAVNGLMALCVLIPVFLVFGGADSGPFAYFSPTWSDLFFLTLIGLLGTLGHLLMTWSLRFAPSATLAPMQYLEIPIATFFGWLIFGDFPNTLASIGILITISAGLYIVIRERQTSLEQKVAGA